MSVSAGRAVVDAGTKAVDTGSGPPVPAGAAAGLAFTPAGDEHGVLTASAGDGTAAAAPPPPEDGGVTSFTSTLPPLGTKVWLQPSHCDPTVYLYDWSVGVKGGVVEGVWRVGARGPGM